VIATALNANGPFITGLISHLDATVINNAMNATTKKSYDPGGPKGMMYDLVRPYNAGNPHDPNNGLNPSIIAGIVNNNATFIGDLMGSMDPVAMSNALETANGRLFINTVLNQLAGRMDVLKNIADALVYNGPQGNAIEMARQLMIALGNHSAVDFLVSQLNAAGNNSSLAMVTMKVWSDNSLLSDPYMYGVFMYTSRAEYPL
jgi:hypothetical protein